MTTDSDKRQSADSEDSLARLLRLAGERPKIPLGIESRVYHRVRQEWRASTAKPNADKVYAEVHKTWKRDARRGWLLRWLMPVGIVASALLAFMIFMQPGPVPPVAVATVVSTISSTSAAQDYVAGASIFEGELITTGSGGGISLLLARNATLRVDENTQVRVDAADQFALLEGRVYADTGEFIYRDDGLSIKTTFGVVRDIGTQFAVTAGPESLDVAVREGRVELAGQADTYAARMGQRLTLVEGQEASLSDLDTHDQYWDWIVGLTPEFDMGNKSLLDFLKWAARETGRELRFETDDSRMFAMRTDIHGSIDGLTPDEALEAILSTTTLQYLIQREKIVISRDDVR
jgi:ferric-dicitrate binding protein FerR (iron transport regulator)